MRGSGWAGRPGGAQSAAAAASHLPRQQRHTPAVDTPGHGGGAPRRSLAEAIVTEGFPIFKGVDTLKLISAASIRGKLGINEELMTCAENCVAVTTHWSEPGRVHAPQLIDPRLLRVDLKFGKEACQGWVRSCI